VKRPKKEEYASFYQTYLDKLPARGTANSLLKTSFKDIQQLLKDCPEETGNYAYAPDKWTLKQVLIHIIDTERVFAFRALWGIRADRATLPGFNQDFWMEQAPVDTRSLASLLKEWKAVRENTLALLGQCSEAQSMQTITASNWSVSVRALFFIIIGHHLHHVAVIRARYLPELAD